MVRLVSNLEKKTKQKSSEKIFEIIVNLDIHVSPLHSNTAKDLRC